MSDLDDLTTNELRDKAKELGVLSISQLRKGQLVAAILTAEGEPEDYAAADTDGQERYVVVVSDDGMYGVEDSRHGRIHDGWWGDGDKGKALAEARAIRANHHDRDRL